MGQFKNVPSLVEGIKLCVFERSHMTFSMKLAYVIVTK